MNVTATLFGQMLTFLVLVWFINKFLWGPLTQMMEDRKKRIADGLAAAERGLHEQQLAERRAVEVIQEAKEQGAKIIADARRRGSEIIEDAKNKAHTEGDRLIAAANAEIEKEVNRAKAHLRGEVVTLSVAGASKVLGREVDAKAHDDLLKDLVAQL